MCSIDLLGHSKIHVSQRKYRVSIELQQGSASALFGYLADCIADFLATHGIKAEDGKIPLGFTFSFPVEQTAINRGRLLRWTKGFNCPDAIGQDVVELLQRSLDAKGVSVTVSALVNDTVGTLLANAYQCGGRSVLGGIFGTGTNGAYLETDVNVNGVAQSMVINTEWGGYDNERAALPINPFDSAVDRCDIRPRTQAFEKMISGMYLGEISRVVLVHLIDRNELFNGYSSARLNTPYAFLTEYMSAAEVQGVPEVKKLLIGDVGVPAEHVSDADVETVRRVCRAVSTRAARLSGTAIAAVLVRTGTFAWDGTSANDLPVVLGFDGSIIEHYPRFQERVLDALRGIFGDAASRIHITVVKDGSGVGAALGALQAKKLGRQ